MMEICSCLYVRVHVSLICTNQENYNWGYWLFILLKWELHNLAACIIACLCVITDVTNS